MPPTLLLYSLLTASDEGQEVKMSNQEAMQQLADRFMNEADFREEMRQDPEGAAERSGYKLDEEDRQALTRHSWHSTR